MAIPNNPAEDIFLPGGNMRPEALTTSAWKAMSESLRLAKATRWDCVRSPHLFMGLLAEPDAIVRTWGQRLGADLSKMLKQFQGLFHQDQNEGEFYLALNREFMSDNSIRLLREARLRAADHERSCIAPVDMLITLLTASNSIVADYFERTGVTAAKLTEQAVIAEREAQQDGV
jgi:ATP-dependent Clp protease ATP-binding subunit ClpA